MKPAVPAGRLGTALALFREGSAAGLGFLSQAIERIAAFVLLLLAAGFLAPAELGIYTLSLAFVVLVNDLCWVGLFSFLIRQKGAEARLRDTVFWLMLAVAAVPTLVVALSAGALARLFEAPGMEVVLLAMILPQPLAAVHGFLAALLLRRREVGRFYRLSITAAVPAFVLGCASVLVLQSMAGLIIARWLLPVSYLIVFVAAVRVVPRPRISRRLAAVAVRYAGPLYAGALLRYLGGFGPDFLIGFYFSTAEAGLYRFGVRLVGALLDVVQHPFNTFTISNLAADWRGGRPLTPRFVDCAKTIVFLNGALALTIIVFAEEALALLFDPAYAGALVVIYAFSLAGILRGIAPIAGATLSVVGSTKAVMACTTAALVLKLAVFAAAAPLGFAAVAWSEVAVTGAVFLVWLWTLARYGRVEIGRLAGPTLSALALVLLYGAAAEGALLLGRSVLGATAPGLLAGVLAAACAGLAVLAVAVKVRAVSLRVFT